MKTGKRSVTFPEKMNVSSKNILIVFDAAGCAPLSLHIAAELAAGLRVGIKALYVEDVNLMKAVDLPFTREISLHTAEIRKIDSTVMRKKFRAAAEDIKKQIEDIADTRSLSISFSSIPGHIAQVVRERAEEVTMVMIPAVYSSNGRKRQQWSKDTVVMLYDDVNELSDNTLDIALSRASNKNHQLVVIVDSMRSKQHVEKLLDEYGARVEFNIADFSDADEVASLIYKYHPSLMLLHESNRLIEDDQVLRQLIDILETDILLVR